MCAVPPFAFPMKAVAYVIGVSRSNLADRLQERSKKRIGRPPLPDDELVFHIEAVIAELPTYGYRRVHAVLKRQALAAGLQPPNHKRVYRIMKVHGLLLARHTAAMAGFRPTISPLFSSAVVPYIRQVLLINAAQSRLRAREWQFPRRWSSSIATAGPRQSCRPT
jgi:HTH-like domain